MTERGSPPAGDAGALVAIIDDDRDILAALGRLVRSIGYEAALFDSAEAYLSAGEGLKPACVLADLQMPGIGGVELIQTLSRRDPSLPLIAMTAYPSEAIRRRALDAGALAFFTKPFDAELLETWLSSLHGSRKT